MGAEFDGFYATHFGATVAMIYRLTTDLDEARDITQEAFCRAWHRWPHLSDYDNPITWVRRVATNLAYSRWRHLHAATTHLQRQRAGDAMVAPPNLDHVTLVAGLRKLPRDQCLALVLHHMLDLPIAQVAEALDVPAGRVKMWLHRGRHTLGTELGESGPRDHRAELGKGRQRTRKAVTKTAAALLAILAAITAVTAEQPIRRSPPPGDDPAPRPARLSPVMNPGAVTLSWQDDRLTIRWTDPSDGYAQPILMGNRQDAGLRQVSVPDKGDTQMIIVGLLPTSTYCLTVVLVYTDNSFLQSGRVCTGQSPARRSGRFEALGLV
jgi:RNA polymerase sigma factor (sigma-70 family)